ncbi:MAG: ATPase [Actinobacteria bacterium 69-20]|nr:MAG: ATPase [Actinobacteria bacterium 69-20]
MTGAPGASAAGGATPALDENSVASEPWWRRVDRMDAARTVFVAVCAAAAGITDASGAAWLVSAGIAVVGLLVGCWPIVVEAWQDVRGRRMSMELSMLIAIVAAAVIGQWVTSLVIAAFVLAAEILEDLSMDRGRDAVTDLMALLPRTVQLRDGDRVRTVPLADIRPGQILQVSPGGAIPVDGTVTAGGSAVDQSRITGESMPVDVTVGDSVYAGSINQTGAIEVRAVRVGAESSYGQIIETVRAAQASPAPVQRLADRLAAWVVYVALVGAAVTYLVTRNVTSTISVVVVAGACGIAAGTPLAVLAAIGRAARTGALIKGGTYLERLSAVDTVIFDKTGTLTHGAPQVVRARPAAGFDPDRVLSLAATGEYYSEHPLGKAIVAHARAVGLDVAAPGSFDYRPGLGVTADIGGAAVRIGNARHVPEAPSPDAPGPDTAGGAATAVHVAVGETYAGTILIADTARESAKSCVTDLHAAGLRVLMLTGDSEQVARHIAGQLGIDQVHAELLPSDKLAVIDAQRAVGHSVVMVGDGINDAPALARADVGIAMGSGTDIARETADVILIGSDLADLTRTVRIARRARRIVMVNFAGTLIVDVAGMILAGVGILTPVAAALIHVGSESAFILNSARLIPGRAHRPAKRVAAAQPSPAVIGSGPR